MSTQTTDMVVKKSVTVQATQERAFTVFTEQVGSWWPPEHHIGTAELADAFIEPRVGGRFYERGTDGSECDWSTGTSSGMAMAMAPRASARASTARQGWALELRRFAALIAG